MAIEGNDLRRAPINISNYILSFQRSAISKDVPTCMNHVGTTLVCHLFFLKRDGGGGE